MITMAIGSTSQFSGMCSRCCQTSTEMPKEEPSDTATVPTMTTAAIRLRVMPSMTMKIRATDAAIAIIRSYIAPSCMSL